MFSGISEIISFSVGSLIWGILVAALCISLFFFMIKNWYKNTPLSFLSYIVCAILFLVLAIHSVFIVGEIKILSSAEEYKIYIQDIFNILNIDGNLWINTSESKPVLDSLFDQYPLLQHYLCDYAYEGYVSDMPSSMVDLFVKLVREELISDILWCIGSVIIAAIIVIISMKDGKRNASDFKQSFTPSDDVF